ncbi:MAG: hypothetical protein Q9182_002346 [Xanthomendoza sp. 2 TL-2023]
MADLDGTPNVDFRDPNQRWDDGPQAPRRPPKSNAACKRQIIWPRDKRQKGAHTWSRWTDILSGKGPDMWVGKQGDDGPTRQQWSHWGYGVFSDILFDNMGYRDVRDNWPDDPNDWWAGHRSTHEKYDFRTRKYKTPGLRDWSDVKWSRTGRRHLYYRDRWGTPHYKQEIMDRQDPLASALGLHPLRYNPQTAHWDWYDDERDPNW